MAVGAGGPGRRQDLHLRAGAQEHEQPVLRPGPRRLQEGREGARAARSSASTSARGEHGGGEEQVQIVQDLIAKHVDGIAVSPANAPPWRTALKQAKADGIPGPHLGLRPAAGGQGPARRLCRHPQLRHRHQPRQDRAGDQAEGRHDLHPVGRRRGGQPQRAHAGHPRHARRHQEQGSARRAPDRPERLDRGRWLPALHRRRLPARGAADGGHPRQVPRARRLRADRRLPAVRARRLQAASPRSTRTGSTSGRWPSSSPTPCPCRWT